MQNRVAARWLKMAISNALMDIVIQARILELVAGKDKNTWTRNPAHDLGKARQYFRDTWETELSPEWTDTRGSGIYKALLQAAYSKTHSKQDAYDIVQAVIGELTTSTENGGALGYLAERLGPEIRDGGGAFNAMKNMLARHVIQKAFDQLRRTTTQERSRREMSPIKVNVTPGQIEESILHETPSTKVFPSGSGYRETLLRSPEGRKFWDRLLLKLSRVVSPQALSIFQRRIEEGRGLTNQEIARELGITGSAVGSTIRKVTDKAAIIIQHDPILQGFPDLFSIQQALGLEGMERLSAQRVTLRKLA